MGNHGQEVNQTTPEATKKKSATIINKATTSRATYPAATGVSKAAIPKYFTDIITNGIDALFRTQRSISENEHAIRKNA